ncbi:MAG: deoxyribonuclease IV [Patescibacteria group bacterium]
MTDKKTIRRIGGHVGVAGGLKNGIARAVEIGANTIQIFGSSPRQWSVPGHSKKNIEEFQIEAKKHGIFPIYLHASYLVNLASPDPVMRKKSEASLKSQLQLTNDIGADGLIFHIGSGKEMPRADAIKVVVEALSRVIKSVKGPADLIIENSAGGGQKVGSSIEEIGNVIKKVGHPKIKVCFDTAHAFEAGIIEEYTPGNIKKLLKDFEKYIGLSRLVALHVNDSKTAFNSHHDRHENLGEGYLGISAFKNLMKEPSLAKVAWILEVPGFDGEGPDRKNIKILHSLI